MAGLTKNQLAEMVATLRAEKKKWMDEVIKHSQSENKLLQETRSLLIDLLETRRSLALANGEKLRELEDRVSFYEKMGEIGDSKKDGKKRGKVITSKERKHFKNLLDDPRAVWKLIDGGKGGAL
jgi:hypothetical protein